MGLWVFNDINIQYVLHRNCNYQRTLNIENIFNVDSSGKFNQDERTLQNYFYHNQVCYADFNSFIASLSPNISYKNKDNIFFKFSSHKKINKIVDSILSQIQYKKNAVDLLKICKEYKINCEFQDQPPKENILGQIIFSPLKITIFNEGTYRSRFTLAHELGHFFLNHDHFLKSEYVTKQTFKESDNKYDDIILSIEREANFFAAALLLPEFNITQALFQSLKKYNVRNPIYLYLDNQPKNIATAELVLRDLSEKFHTSIQAISIRLQKLNLLIDDRFTKTNFYSISQKLQN